MPFFPLTTFTTSKVSPGKFTCEVATHTSENVRKIIKKYSYGGHLEVKIRIKHLVILVVKRTLQV